MTIPEYRTLAASLRNPQHNPERRTIIAATIDLGCDILEELRQNAKNRAEALSQWQGRGNPAPGFLEGCCKTHNRVIK